MRPFGGRRPHPLTGDPIAWTDWLALGLEMEAIDRLRRATLTGRPLGSDDFVTPFEHQIQRRLKPAKRGPKLRAAGDPEDPADAQSEPSR